MTENWNTLTANWRALEKQTMLPTLDGDMVPRNLLPGWLLKLIDEGDAYEIGYAERYCADHLNRSVLAAARQRIESAA